MLYSLMDTVSQCSYVLILVAAAAVSVAVFLNVKSKRLGNEHLIPTPPGHIPILGHMLKFLRPDYHRLLLSLADQLGPVYRVK